MDDESNSRKFDIKEILCGNKKGRDAHRLFSSNDPYTNNDRQYLVKILGKHLMLTATKENEPTISEKHAMCESIIKVYPRLRAKTGPITKEDWVQFYDERAHTGFLHWFIKNKRKNDKHIDTRPYKKRRSGEPEIITAFEDGETPEEIFLRNTVATHSTINRIEELMESTRTFRRKWITTTNPSAKQIIERWPRLLDTNNAMELEYLNTVETEDGFPLAYNLEKNQDKILHLARWTLTHCSEVIDMLNRGEETNEKDKATILVLPYFFNVQPKRGVSSRVASHDRGSLLLQEFWNESPDECISIAESKGMKQPGIIKIKEFFFVSVDRHLIPVKKEGLFNAIEFLLGCYYVFNLEYPVELKNVFSLLEKLAGLKKVKLSPVVQDLYNKLK